MTKTILVTGAASNLGRAAVKKFSSEGHRVIALVSYGKGFDYPLDKSVSFYEANLADEEETHSVYKNILRAHPLIDGAVLTVGGFAMGSIATTDGEAIQKMITLNFNTAYFTARPLFLHMLSRQTGRIIFIGAQPAIKAEAGKEVLAYALSKSLIFKLSELLNAEGASKNVFSSVIVPSIIDTPANRAAMPTADFTQWIPPEKIANVIYSLVMNEKMAEQNPIITFH